MKESLITRGIFILAIMGFALFLASPPSEKVKLGLDLQGGMHLVLGVQTRDALRAETDHDKDRFKGRLEEEGVTTAEVSRPPEVEDEDDLESITRFKITGIPSDKESVVEEIHRDFFSEFWAISQTSDTEDGNLAFDFTMRETAVRQIRNQAVDQAMRTIRNRVDEFGLTEPVIQRQGFSDSDRLVVQLPGVEDPERIKRLIKQTAFLEWRLADFPRGGSNGVTREEIDAHYGGQVPPNVEILEGPIRDADEKIIGTSYYGVERSSVVTGRDMKNAKVSSDQFGAPVVSFTLSYEMGERFGGTTSSNIGRALVIVLDKKVVSAPTIRGKINDRGQIDGGFDFESASDLATQLRSGALPAGIKILEERTVGPSLGQDSIDQGMRAGMLGGAMVVGAMLLVYLLAGVNAIFVLSLNVVLVFALLAGFSATLTLPGIAGIILTIGMAVDANVLIFERIREELRAGRTVKAAVDAGFRKALSSILDANITTFIAALFLFEFGTGPIRGFAVTLSIGILASVFTAVFVSRFLFDAWLSRRQRVERLYI